MTACYLSPIGNSTQTSTSGAPLSGGLIYTYQAGTTTLQATYMDNSGSVGQANPIVLNTYGLPSNPIWLVGGQAYKFVIKDALGNTIRTIDSVNGINDANGRLIGVQRFTASGTYTPTSGMQSVIVEVQGGGGAGGGSAATGAGQLSVAGGGASGAYGKGRYTSAQVGASQAITVGTGGVGAANAAGGNGGASSFGALLSAPGGLGAGAGPVISSTTVTIIGGAASSSAATGGTILNSNGISGSYGLNVSTGTISGAGGGSPFASGSGGGNLTGTSTPADSARAPGGAGGGACSGQSDIARAGGNGAGGVVVVYEYA